MRIRRPSNRVLLSIACLVIVLLLVATGILLYRYNKLRSNPGATTNAVVQRVIGEVSRLYLVPTDETPVVMQIQNKAQLDNQKFFDNAQSQDFVLLYKTHRLAIVYRENSNKLINVGPISFTSSNGTPAQPTTDR